MSYAAYFFTLENIYVFVSYLLQFNFHQIICNGHIIAVVMQSSIISVNVNFVHINYSNTINYVEVLKQCSIVFLLLFWLSFLIPPVDGAAYPQKNLATETSKEPTQQPMVIWCGESLNTQLQADRKCLPLWNIKPCHS